MLGSIRPSVRTYMASLEFWSYSEEVTQLNLGLFLLIIPLLHFHLVI